MNARKNIENGTTILNFKNIDQKYNLTETENDKIDLLLETLVQQGVNPEDPSFLIEAAYYANQFPESIVKAMYKFKYRETKADIILISGIKFRNRDGDLCLPEDLIGVTPLDHLSDDTNVYLKKVNLYLIMLSSLLGDPFGWNSQHNGKLINNVLPVLGKEKEQLSIASEVTLEWHTEEAFHEFRADHLGLICLRNPDQVATTICTIDTIDLPDSIKDILFQKRFIFLSDTNFEDDVTENLSLIPILFGNYRTPYLRIDPAFMKVRDQDHQAKQALTYIVNEINSNLFRIPLRSGEVCFINNHKAVHGRDKFTPRYDGTDRWLKRINITRDIAKSRGVRNDDISRVLNTK